MSRVCVGALLTAMLFAASTNAQILLSYEDLDPDGTSPVGNGLTITGGDTGGRTGVGIVDVGAATGTFTSLLTDPATFDVTGFVGKSFSAAAEAYIPSISTINEGDSIYLTIDYFNSSVGAAGAGNFVRSNAGFFSAAAPRDQWLPMNLDGFVPAMTDNGDAIDSANVRVVVTDGGFGGLPNDSGFGEFAYLDNFSYVVQEPLPPNPVFFSEDAPSNLNMTEGNVLFEPALDPNDASNDVGEVIFGGLGTFVNVNIGAPVDVSPFEGQKFRASFDYLVPADTALESGDDTFWLQLAFNDPASASTPQGAGNSTSAGFPAIADVADGVWRTIEITGVIPPDTDGATFSIVTSDDGFGGGPADSFGTGFFVDNVIFEAVDVVDGDFNNDGVVNAADYTVWRDNDGTAAPTGPPYAYRDAVELSGERSINFAGDGANGVNGDDYTVWSNNYGSPAEAMGAAVPEPAGACLLLFGAAVTLCRRQS